MNQSAGFYRLPDNSHSDGKNTRMVGSTNHRNWSPKNATNTNQTFHYQLPTIQPGKQRRQAEDHYQLPTIQPGQQRPQATTRSRPNSPFTTTFGRE
jgi:hypothetical protein